jgi:hypothetical protein
LTTLFFAVGAGICTQLVAQHHLAPPPRK